MNKSIIILITVIVPLLASSQEYEYVPFPDSGAIWSEVYYYPDPIWPDTVIKQPSYERFALNGEDTIINDITYNKLFIFYDSIFYKANATYIGGIREDENRRIYFKSDTSIHEYKPMNWFYDYNEIILYDFSLKIGDTIKNINCRPEDDMLIVSGIDSVLINNQYRKMFHFQIPWVKWIEGIGSVKGLLFTSGDLPTNGINNTLICFKQNNTLLYMDSTYSKCYFHYDGIKENKTFEKNIKIFPNPVSDISILDFREFNDIEFINIYSLDGTLVKQLNTKGKNKIFINRKNYLSGMYFYRAKSNKGKYFSGRFIIL